MVVKTVKNTVYCLSCFTVLPLFHRSHSHTVELLTPSGQKSAVAGLTADHVLFSPLLIIF